jgi:hypothetical protein
VTSGTASPHPEISKEDQTTLNWLRWNWEDDYAVSFDGAVWTAIPRAAPDAPLRAPSPVRLRQQLALDYATRAIRSGATELRWREFCSRPPEPV